MTDAAGPKGPPTDRVSLFVSDVDGTLVTHDKTLAASTIEAAQRLHEAGIALAIVSSRPPRGMVHLPGPLGIEMFGGFNGSAIVRPDLSPIEEHYVPLEAAGRAVEMMGGYGVDIWVFADNEWYITNPDGAYVPREKHTVSFDPTVVSDFGPYLGRVGKIVGSSKDFDMLARCEGEMQAALGDTASARRSQSYYLDVTNQTADKGHAVRAFARHFGVPLEEVAVIGDMANDLPMFATGNLSIAMGNALPEIKAKANFATASNEEDGWAKAVEQYILPRAKGAA